MVYYRYDIFLWRLRIDKIVKSFLLSVFESIDCLADLIEKVNIKLLVVDHMSFFFK